MAFINSLAFWPSDMPLVSTPDARRKPSMPDPAPWFSSGAGFGAATGTWAVCATTGRGLVEATGFVETTWVSMGLAAEPDTPMRPIGRERGTGAALTPAPTSWAALIHAGVC